MKKLFSMSIHRTADVLFDLIEDCYEQNRYYVFGLLPKKQSESIAQFGRARENSVRHGHLLHSDSSYSKALHARKVTAVSRKR